MYSLSVISAIFIGENFIFYTLKISLGLFVLGVVSGLIHVLKERFQENKKEDLEKLKDY